MLTESISHTDEAGSDLVGCTISESVAKGFGEVGKCEGFFEISVGQIGHLCFTNEHVIADIDISATTGQMV